LIFVIVSVKNINSASVVSALWLIIFCMEIGLTISFFIFILITMESKESEIITSLDNPSIKLARSLLQRKNRKFYGAFLVEGERFVKEAIINAEGLEKIFVESSYVDKYKDMLDRANCSVVVVSAKVLESLCETVTPQGIVAQVTMMPSINFVPTQPFIVLDGLQDPGNMGTIIRSAVATNTPDIVLINTVDVFNPKVVRASAGTLFHANFYPLSHEELLEICEKYDYGLVVTEMFGQNVFDDPKMPDRYALVIGNEGNGVSDVLLSHKDLGLTLPMNRKVESLNAGVSASILLYLLKGKNINRGED